MYQTTLTGPESLAILDRLRAWLRPRLQAGERFTLSVDEERRNLSQNARMWAMLSDISRQVEWHGMKLSKDDWKDMASASLKRQRVVPGIDGGFVVLGQRTSEMSKADMSELLEFLEAFGAQHGVRFRTQDAD